jgi:hypothetical protein
MPEPEKKTDQQVIAQLPQEFQDSLANLPNNIQAAVVKGINQAALANRQVESDDDDDDLDFEARSEEDLEKMSRGQLSAYITQMVAHEMKGLLKPLAADVKKAQNLGLRTSIEAQVAKARQDHKDFDQFREEMQAVAKQHPDLTVEQLYTLARSNNPTKVAELEAADKAKAEELEKVEKEKEAATQPTFGGLFPTSGMQTREPDNQKMSAKDAAVKAFDQVFESIPAEYLQAND